jgi:hypothetical protein
MAHPRLQLLSQPRIRNEGGFLRPCKMPPNDSLKQKFKQVTAINLLPAFAGSTKSPVAGCPRGGPHSFAGAAGCGKTLLGHGVAGARSHRVRGAGRLHGI